jgi:uncharacterized protein (DUF488 family)
MKTIKVFTVGYTQKSAEKFFKLLQSAGVKRVVDIRISNSSQLAGFAKKDDLKFFLKKVADIEYVHMVDLAPTKEILDDYKKKKIDWEEYERRFKELLEKRGAVEKLEPEFFDRACLLCGEPTAEQCHRRLVVERMKKVWGDVEIKHLV